MVCIKFEKFASLCVVNVMCLSKPCTFEWQNLEQTDQWLALQKSIFLCDYLTKSDGVFTECREIVIFSYLEIILWFTHHFESYLCGKSDCNFFWDIWYILWWAQTFQEKSIKNTSWSHNSWYQIILENKFISNLLLKHFYSWSNPRI